MENPFLKRASEHLRDDEAFLAVVSPEPVTFFLRGRGQAGTLYDRLLFMQGTPGSGKTTLARLFEYPTLTALLRNRSSSGYQSLAGALVECGGIVDERPAVIGCRLTMETDYRDLGIPLQRHPQNRPADNLRAGKSGAGMVSSPGGSGYPGLGDTHIPRPDAETAVDAIGGPGAEGVLARAREVEAAAYEIVGALIAPGKKISAQQ